MLSVTVNTKVAQHPGRETGLRSGDNWPHTRDRALGLDRGAQHELAARDQHDGEDDHPKSSTPDRKRLEPCWSHMHAPVRTAARCDLLQQQSNRLPARSSSVFIVRLQQPPTEQNTRPGPSEG